MKQLIGGLIIFAYSLSSQALTSGLCTDEALKKTNVIAAYRCQSETDKEEVCLQVKAQLDGSRALTVTDSGDSYSQGFENAGSSSSCGDSGRVCVRSMVRMDNESINGTMAAVDLSLAATFHAFVTLDLKTMTGQFESRDDNSSFEDNFSACKAVK